MIASSRQSGRCGVPGRNGTTARRQKLEREMDLSAQALERELVGGNASAGEGFETRVLPPWSPVGGREGHEVLTRIAARRLGLGPAETDALVTGVIIPDRGGRSYSDFPRHGIPGALVPGNQSSHALRRYLWTTKAAALSEIRDRLTALYRGVLTASSWLGGWQTAGEALHLIQDGYSCAHVDRPLCHPGATGNQINRIRVFSPSLPVTFGYEHGFPSDSRDQIKLPSGALRPEADAAVTASQEFLSLLLVHRAAPSAPRNAAQFTAFLNRHFPF